MENNLTKEELEFFAESPMVNKEAVELMANDIINFLKKKKMWETDTGLIFNGKHVDHNGVEDHDENLKGVMRIWYEGPLNHALNYGTDDKKFSIYNGLKEIMEKHGYYFEFDSNSDMNVYPL